MSQEEKKEKYTEGNTGGFLSSFGMTVRFAIGFFVILCLAVLVSLVFMFFLHHIGILSSRASFEKPLLLFAFTSLLLGCFFSLIFSRRILAPIREAIDAVDELAGGNFDVHIELKGTKEAQELSRSFNHMAEELGSIELLRSDFVNNFSHEFKTPISSIRGFARMLQRDDLTSEEREEYLEIIVSESERLTELATNVLNLSKIENQTILSNQTVYNCSEQIRRTIVLLEPKWSKKGQRFFLECDEIRINANMELMEQVWINLFDNAIKFSPENTVIEVLIRKRPDYILVTVSDKGCGIRQEAETHIFDKFYQGDISHTVSGNGLGLAIVKKIVELHQGSVRIADTGEDGTTFEVVLPMNLPTTG